MTSRTAQAISVAAVACVVPASAAADPPRASAAKPIAPLAPERLDYKDGASIPPGYHLRSELRTDVLIASGIIFWTAYSTQSAISFISGRLACELKGKPPWCEEGRRYYPLFIPVVGPFVFTRTGNATPAEQTGLIAVGALQIAGIMIITAAVTSPRKVLIRNTPAITVSPKVGRGMMGLSVEGML
jgi:hypothetical protein